jgi:hypothetical protein
MATKAGDLEFRLTADSAQLGTALKRAQGAIEETGAAGKRLGDKVEGGFSRAEKAADRVGGAMRKLRGAASSVSPEFASVVNVVDDAADVFELFSGASASVAVSAGIVGAAVAALAGVYLVLKGNLDEANAAMKVQADRATVAQAAGSKLTAALDAANDQWDLATGAASDHGLELRKATRSIDDGAAATRALLEAEVATTKARRDAKDVTTDEYAAYERATETLDAFNQKIDDAKTKLELKSDKTRLDEEATEAAKEAEEERTRALAAAVKAEAASNKELQEAIRLRDERVESEEEWLAFLDREKERQAENAQAEQEAMIATAEVEKELQQESLDRDRQAAEERIELNEQVRESAIEAARDAFDAISGLIDMELDRRTETISALEDALTDSEANLTESQRAEIEVRIAAEKNAARRAFRVSQALQIASAVASTALAVINALTTVPYPAGLIAAGAAAIVGLASVATIVSQKPVFHAGGVVAADLLPGEAVLNRQAVRRIGEDGVSRMNAGMGDASGGGVSIRIGRMEAREILRTDVRAGGMLTQTIRRHTRRDTVDTGLTGRDVLA